MRGFRFIVRYNPGLSPNQFLHPWQIFADLAVPKPKHLQPFILQEFSPSHIIFALFWNIMLSPIQFNDQILFRAKEIQNVISKRLLSTKLQPCQFPIPKLVP